MSHEAGIVKFEISQVAMVVPDLEASMREYHRLHGWGTWNIYEYKPPRLRDLLIAGEPAAITWIGAEVEVGPMWVELLQPLEGTSVFGEWLALHGPGVHHVGYYAPTAEESVRVHDALASTGAKELLSAWIDDVHFYYMDTQPVITEVWTGDMESIKASRVFP